MNGVSVFSFGWTLTGSFPVKTKPPPMTISACSMLNSGESNFGHERLVGLVQRFWAKSTSDLECERIYATGHRRDSSDRYIVPLPIKGNDLSLLGESYLYALAALKSAHRRMQRDDTLHTSTINSWMNLFSWATCGLSLS